MPPLLSDLGFTQVIQQYHPAWLTTAMKLISAIISPELMFGLGLVTVVYLHLKKHDDRTIVTLFCIAIGNVLIPILKDLVARPRPSPAVVHVFVQESGYSFPSGHALGVVLLGGMIAVLIRRLARHHQRLWLAGVTLMILLVGYSRIYLGVHWLSDVLGGFVIGFIWVILAMQVTLPLNRFTTKPPRG